ncbi:MAG TPA: YceI family protein [Anaeromyxobacter sp.]|nr:YceI family protein [Anaeromyxobacter sp.]
MFPSLAVLALLAAGAPEPQAYSVDAARSTITYHLHHKLHAADGRSSSIEGKAVVQPDGKVLAMVRVPVSSFDSGDANRDSNMRDTLQAARHPFVVFKGVTSLVLPASHGKAIPATLAGELEFHGVKHALEVPVTLQFADDGSASVKGKVNVSLEAHGIARPSLLMIKVDDALGVEFDLKLRRG